MSKGRDNRRKAMRLWRKKNGGTTPGVDLEPDEERLMKDIAARSVREPNPELNADEIRVLARATGLSEERAAQALEDIADVGGMSGLLASLGFEVRPKRDD